MNISAIKMFLKVHLSLLTVLLGVELAFATFNFGGNSIITIIEDEKGVLCSNYSNLFGFTKKKLKQEATEHGKSIKAN